MDEFVNVKGKNVDEAITEALIQLGITSDLLDYEVVDKGSAGFLGIGARQAIIRARRKTEVVEVKEPEVVKPEPKTEKKVESNPEVKKEVKKEIKKEPKKDFHKEEKHSDRPKKNFEKKQEKKEAPIHNEKTAVQEKEHEKVVIQQETIDVVEKFLKDVMNTMGLEVELVSKVDDEGALNVEIKGNEMGILIGKRGQTLDSLQYLTSRVANKVQDGYIRVKLDTENYRARRKATLENLARNIAHKVKKTRRPVALEPMNPYERRIIHSALQNDRYVTTHSEGEEPYRKVVITLNKNR